MLQENLSFLWIIYYLQFSDRKTSMYLISISLIINSNKTASNKKQRSDSEYLNKSYKITRLCSCNFWYTVRFYIITIKFWCYCYFNFRRRSNILNDYKCSTSSANLLILESVAWDASEHVVPILHSKSCLPFLYDLSEFVLNSDNTEVSIHFFNKWFYYYNCIMFCFKYKTKHIFSVFIRNMIHHCTVF